MIYYVFSLGVYGPLDYTYPYSCDFEFWSPAQFMGNAIKKWFISELIAHKEGYLQYLSHSIT